MLEASAMDFDDLLMITCELFAAFPDVLEHYQERFQYIHVDEYQDTNRAQYTMVSQLAGLHRNVCVVGDGDQSIYKFRGADIRNILDFEKDYPDAKVVVLDQNYRSTETILNAANSVIANNTSASQSISGPTSAKVPPSCDMRPRTSMTRQRSSPTRSHHSNRQVGQLRMLPSSTERMRRAASSKRYSFDMAFPTTLSAACGSTSGARSRTSSPTYGWLSNPDEPISVKRVINLPKRGIGVTSVGHIDRFAEGQNITFFDALRHVDEISALSTRAANAVRDFLAVVDVLLEKALGGPTDAVTAVLHETGYLASVENEKTIESMGSPRIFANSFLVPRSSRPLRKGPSSTAKSGMTWTDFDVCSCFWSPSAWSPTRTISKTTCKRPR